jgi:hypothetical protein
MRKQIEMLKHHAGRGAEGRQLAVAGFAAASLAEEHLTLADPYPTAVRLLEQVDAAQKGGFPRSARSDYRDDGAALHLQGYAPQHLHRAKRLPQIGNLDHGA